MCQESHKLGANIYWMKSTCLNVIKILRLWLIMNCKHLVKGHEPTLYETLNDCGSSLKFYNCKTERTLIKDLTSKKVIFHKRNIGISLFQIGIWMLRFFHWKLKIYFYLNIGQANGFKWTIFLLWPSSISCGYPHLLTPWIGVWCVIAFLIFNF